MCSGPSCCKLLFQALVRGPKRPLFGTEGTREGARGRCFAGCFLHLSFFYGKGGFVLAEWLRLNRNLQAGSRRVFRLFRRHDDTFAGVYFTELPIEISLPRTESHLGTSSSFSFRGLHSRCPVLGEIFRNTYSVLLTITVCNTLQSGRFLPFALLRVLLGDSSESEPSPN